MPRVRDAQMQDKKNLMKTNGEGLFRVLAYYEGGNSETRNLKGARSEAETLIAMYTKMTLLKYVLFTNAINYC